MSAAVIQILTGGLGTLGFALCSHVRVKHLLTATVGGMLGWAIYLLVMAAGGNLFVCNLISAMAAYAWSECMARTMKAPVTIFLVPGVIPLLPGSYLYYTMRALLYREMEQFQRFGMDTILTTMGIACGVVICSIVISYFIKTREQLRAARRRGAKHE